MAITTTTAATIARAAPIQTVLESVIRTSLSLGPTFPPLHRIPAFTEF
jgi:hypothetical protein